MSEEILDMVGLEVGVSVVTQSGAVVGLELLLQQEEPPSSGEEDDEG